MEAAPPPQVTDDVMPGDPECWLLEARSDLGQNRRFNITEFAVRTLVLRCQTFLVGGLCIYEVE